MCPAPPAAVGLGEGARSEAALPRQSPVVLAMIPGVPAERLLRIAALYHGLLGLVLLLCSGSFFTFLGFE